MLSYSAKPPLLTRYHFITTSISDLSVFGKNSNTYRRIQYKMYMVLLYAKITTNMLNIIITAAVTWSYLSLFLFPQTVLSTRFHLVRISLMKLRGSIGWPGSSYLNFIIYMLDSSGFPKHLISQIMLSKQGELLVHFSHN